MPEPNFPGWLHALAIASLVLGFVCAAVVAVDQARRPPHMWIMALVWPLTALFGSVLWLAAYFAWGRGAPPGPEPRHPPKPPFPAAVLKGASHCGAGCTLGDIVAEWLALAVPAVAVGFGWGTLFAEKMYAVWALDFLLAFLFGIAFQYFTIAPMRGLSPGEGLAAALKADVASISAWQVGMYGMMAIVQLAWFAPLYGGTAPVASPEFWFAMQLAMLAGFVTSYPVNWWLIRIGVKEEM
ncbi:Integral membrane protein [uncultured Alphaproteobacteria bacterium]|uniref:Integral membrane protein n=1 Tax=uncultured Alphaproteobacteria bacterium TaxID=91750 RepID=A0A212JQZ8_9PROT|nr:Integral membrane protein [uncultured Alphaproteobacteria bacterium]